MSKKYFVAGTDTDVGKTLIVAGLLAAANRKALRTLALKPIAAGCEDAGEGLRNDDALLLQQTMSQSLPYVQVNPVAFEPPIAPHIAAQQQGKQLSVSQLAGYCRGALMTPADLVLVEGAGGWRVPLNNVETMASLAQALRLPVILVVGMKLGCINHALLTAEAIAHDGLPLAGWVANRIDPDMACYNENFATLQRRLPAPCLGQVPWLDVASPAKVAEALSIESLV